MTEHGYVEQAIAKANDETPGVPAASNVVMQWDDPC